MQRLPGESKKWCRYIVNVGHITTFFMIVAHVIWYYAARDYLVAPPNIYLRNHIILPSIGFLIFNSLVELLFRWDKVSPKGKEYMSISIFLVLSFFLSMTHIISKALLTSFVLPIFISSIFSNIKISRWALSMSILSVVLIGGKYYFMGSLDFIMKMEIFVAIFMFFCAYLLTGILIKHGKSNIASMVKAKEETLNAEFAFLQAQIKPHFIYNALNTIVSFCYTDGEKAANLLNSFSKYLRLIFDINYKTMLVPLKRELELIDTYVNIEKERFGELINVEYNVDQELFDLELPSFCIQPLVENSIKHGLLGKEGGGKILITAQKDEGFIKISVEDTGVGMSAEKIESIKLMKREELGVGVVSVITRLQAWRNTEFDIQSSLGEGTSISFVISN